jgi:3-oxoacyl-[acyl-carrier protein] reductase
MSRRTALVAGATRGIGWATALALRDAGMAVAATHRGEPGTEPGEQAGLRWFRCDVTSTASVDACFDQVEADLGNVEVLVVSAGITRDRLAVRTTDADLDAVLDTNVAGALRLVRRATPRMMRARWGRIVLMSSVVAAAGQAGQTGYAASKAALVGMGRSLARELASRSITVNLVAPGPIETDMLTAVPDKHLEAITNSVPLGRTGQADEVASAVRWLTSDDAGFVTGAVIPVDGGMGMGPW